MDVQTMTYGYGKVPLENIGWKTKGKKTGWMGNEAGCKKKQT